MNAAEIRTIAASFYSALEAPGQAEVRNIVAVQYSGLALYEIAAQLAELNDALRVLTGKITPP